MKARTIRNTAVACSVIGLLIVLFMSRIIELSKTSVSQITVDDVQKNVRICGKIISKTVSAGQHVFLKLNDNTGIIDVVAFNSSAKSLGAYDVEKYDDVCITGEVNEYQNKLEIILRKRIEKSG